MSINLELSDQKFKIEAFLHLVKVLKKLGIQIDLESENDARRDALAFAVESLYHMYSKTNWRLLVQDLLDKADAFKNASEATWFLDQEIEMLFKAQVVELMAHADEARRKNMEAIANLFFAAKKRNAELHKKGLPVHFGGIPGDLIPKWCSNKIK